MSNSLCTLSLFHIYSDFTGHVVCDLFNCTAVLRMIQLNSSMGTWNVFCTFQGRFQAIKGRIRKAES